MSRITGVVLVAVLTVLAIATAAYAAPSKPAPAPYTLGQEIVVESGLTGTDRNTVVTVTCPGNKVVSGGGFDGNASSATVQASKPGPGGNNQWTAIFGGSASPNESVAVYAVCVNP